MKTLSCKDVSGLECDFIAKGETAEAAVSMLKDHGMSAHAEMMQNASEEQMAAMGEKMQSMMKDEE